MRDCGYNSLMCMSLWQNYHSDIYHIHGHDCKETLTFCKKCQFDKYVLAICH